MKRARSSLPKSPRKRRIIAAGLAKEAGLVVSPVSASKSRGNQGLSEDKATSYRVLLFG